MGRWVYKSQTISWLPFESKAAEVRLGEDKVSKVRKRCINFIVSLTNELRERLPNNIKTLQGMSVFNVERALNHNKGFGEILSTVRLFGYSPNETDKIVQQ